MYDSCAGDRVYDHCWPIDTSSSTVNADGGFPSAGAVGEGALVGTAVIDEVVVGVDVEEGGGEDEESGVDADDVLTAVGVTGALVGIEVVVACTSRSDGSPT